MKRIEKGPVRGISLKLQEEVSKFLFLFFWWVGKRKKNGFRPRQIRDSNRQHRVQGSNRQATHQRARHQETCKRTQTRQKI